MTALLESGTDRCGRWADFAGERHQERWLPGDVLVGLPGWGRRPRVSRAPCPAWRPAGRRRDWQHGG